MYLSIYQGLIMRTAAFKVLMTASLISITATGCSNFSKEDTHRAMCNQLKANLIFGGNTSIARQANIQNAEKPMQQQMYEKNKC
jgi:hypothetical protein